MGLRNLIILSILSFAMGSPIATGAPIDELKTAIFRGNVEKAISLINADHSLITTRDDNGNTLAHFVAMASNPVSLKLLTDFQAPCDEKNEKQVRPIHAAFMGGNSRVIDYFLKSGSKPDVFCAAASNDIELVKRFVEQDRKTMSASLCGMPLIHWAALTSSTDTLSWLLDKGADPRAIGQHGETALHVAAKRNNMKVVQLLITRGALVNSQDDLKRTPLFWSALVPARDAAAVLMVSGADASIPDRWGLKPLVQAAILGSSDFVEIVAPFSSEADKCEALLQSAAEGHVGTLNILLISGISPNFTIRHRSPLECAIEGGHVEAVRSLIAFKADVSGLNDEHDSALHVAAREGNAAIVEALLGAGANTEIVDASRNRPLDLAISFHHPEVAKLLRDGVSKKVSSQTSIRQRQNPNPKQ